MDIHERRQELIKLHVSKPGWRGKVNAMCIDCTYDPKSGEGTWRQQVEKCAIESCPLYSIRPKSRGLAK